MRFLSTLPVKIFALLVLILLLLLPVESIMHLIDGRAAMQRQVENIVSGSSSGPQTMIGPILVIPYEIHRKIQTGDGKNKKWEVRISRSVSYFLPENLDIKSQLKVDPRQIGIYQAQTYNGPVNFNGKFTVPVLPSLLAENVKIGEPYLSIGIGDPRGIHNIKPLQLNGTSFAFRPGTRIAAFEAGIHAPVKLGEFKQLQTLEFNFEVELQGTSRIAVVPVGESTSYSLSSNWPHPNFIGDFLPITHDIGPQGFTAEWKSSWFANNMNSRLEKILANGGNRETSADVEEHEITISAGGRAAASQPAFSNSGGRASSLPTFSTSLIQTVDQYQLNERSVKYAVLFIGLTFVVFFLFEVLKGLRVHPVQYALVGMALSLFYLLLLALSEHIGFDLAYLIASSACVALITFYVSHVLHSVKRALGFGTLLGLLYVALWGLLQSEDNALLLGSGLLFSVLAIIMIVTRKIDWYKLGKGAREQNDDLPPEDNFTPLATEA